MSAPREEVHIDGTVTMKPVATLSPCVCGVQATSDDPRVIERIRSRSEFRTPCQCGRMLVFRGGKIHVAVRMPKRASS